MYQISVSKSIEQIIAGLPAHYERNNVWVLKGVSVAADRYTLLSPSYLTVNINNVGYIRKTQLEIILSEANMWDTITPTDYTVAANRAGKDFYIYVCTPGSGSIPIIIISNSSSSPVGYTTTNSRKIGGFHCLCASVGTISGHALTGFLTGDILPASIWDLKFMPKNASPEGMLYSAKAGIWVDIYLASGTGINTKSLYAATISDSRNWMDFVDDGASVKKRLLNDMEFQIIAANSNEQTNITGSADPVTTGGHIDTASRRMISDIGCEDCCGAMWQWLSDQSFRFDWGTPTANAASMTYTVFNTATPGGNPIYLKFDDSGEAYLCCNIGNDAVDKVLVFNAGGNNYKVVVKHDVNAATGGYQVYYNNNATQPNRLLCNMTLGSNANYMSVKTNNPVFTLRITHDANAASNGVAVYYDDATDERLEANIGATGTLDLTNYTPTWQYVSPGGAKGQLYIEGQIADVRLLAGAYWTYGPNAGSRARGAHGYRWYTGTHIGCRFAAEPAN
ncbi:MAG TPA: phage major tropism determinant [Candidatus Wunengus sp. YC60]|uniref:phage major tropism determinant n=1 Tax=Candidatus Wunengus sp. YC60 TaxID=3367697 RepID=UPI004024A916